MKIDILKSYNYKPEHQIYYNQVLALTHTICDTYPGHAQWFNDKFMPGLRNNDGRAYCFAVSGPRLTGVSLLKNTADEKKICCLFVSPDCRRMGVASKLMQDSIAMLRTQKPLITISNNNLEQLQPLINRFGFELSRTQAGAYRSDLVEYFYNEHYLNSK